MPLARPVRFGHRAADPAGIVAVTRNRAVPAANVEHAVQRRHPLPHAEQAESATVTDGCRRAVGDGRDQRAIAAVDGHGDRLTGRVPRGVGQCILHDPKAAQLHRLTQALQLRAVVDRGGDRHAAGPHAVEENRQVGQAGLRRELCHRLGVAQNAQHGAQLVERYPGPGGDLAERGAYLG